MELLEADPDKYGTLLNASYAAAHINRRVELLEDLEQLQFGPHRPALVRKEETETRGRHYEELVVLIDKALPMFEEVLVYLGGEVPPEKDADVAAA